MQKSGWWESAKLYELYVDKFAGNFQGLTSKLDYFVHLGINALHILPHYPSPMRDDGYDISDYEAIRLELGTMDDFRAFVEAAHTRGIHVLIDLVLNHVSTEHPWFREARASRHNPKRDFFFWSDTGSEARGLENPFVDFKPNNWIRNEATGDFYHSTFYPEQADLNWNNSEIKEAMFAHTDFWVQAGVDGFRLDALPFMIKDAAPMLFGKDKVHALVRNLRARLDSSYGGRVALLGEVGRGAAESREYFRNGEECHLVYNFDMAQGALYALAFGDRSKLENATTESLPIPENCRWGVFLRNHDDIFLPSLSAEERTALFEAIDPRHQYSFNKGRSCAVRLATALGGDEQKILGAFQMLYAMRGVPIFYYGDEIGMQNLPLQTDVSDTRKYLRGTFDWELAEKMLADPESLLNKTAEIIRSARVK